MEENCLALQKEKDFCSGDKSLFSSSRITSLIDTGNSIVN